MPHDPLLPRAVVLALHWDRLRDRADPAELRLLEGDDEPHTLGTQPLAAALAGYRAHEVWAVLPSPGDPQGLRGAAAAAGSAAGEAVVVREVREAEHAVGIHAVEIHALVPEVTSFGSALERGHLVRWRAFNDAAGSVPMLLPDEARAALVSALHSATEELTRLDVARERPELREALIDLAGPPSPAIDRALSPLPERSAALALQALRVLRIVELASTDDGAAVTSGQIGARSAALRELARAARDAVAAATFRRLP